MVLYIDSLLFLFIFFSMFFVLIHDYKMCFTGSPYCIFSYCKFSYYNYISIWPYYIVIHYTEKNCKGGILRYIVKLAKPFPLMSHLHKLAIYEYDLQVVKQESNIYIVLNSHALCVVRSHQKHISLHQWKPICGNRCLSNTASILITGKTYLFLIKHIVFTYMIMQWDK